eukprot:COSAG04_NODE_4942_length_1813_cov_3.041318_1_plen_417_part_00
MVDRPLLAVLALLPAARAPITGCLNGVEACSCEWAADNTDSTTLAGLSHPGDYSAAQIAATGLQEAVIKGADANPQACERVCCEALLITDAPAAAQAPAQTGPCGVWQHGGGTGASGCWLGLDNTKRKPPLPEVPERSGSIWTGGARKLCRVRRIVDAAAACPPSFPYASWAANLDGKVCYTTSIDAAAGTGECGSWCTRDVSVGTGCPGDNAARLCSSAAAAAARASAGAQFCSSNWGWYFLSIAVVVGALYLGGGVAAGARTGAGMRLAAHPHYTLWRQLYGLVLDGAEFSQRRAAGGGASSRLSRHAELGGGRRGGANAEGDISAAGSTGSTQSRDKRGQKGRQKAKSGKRRTRKDKAGGAGLGQPLLDGGAEATEPEQAGQTAEERWQARHLEERAQQGVHSSQAKVTVVGQ